MQVVKAWSAYSSNIKHKTKHIFKILHLQTQLLQVIKTSTKY